MNEAKIPFRRDRATWSIYLLVCLINLQVSLIGPIMPFLRAEMGLSYAQGALHTSAFALGMMAAGFLCDPLERRVGRKAALVIAALGLAVGFTVIVTAPSPVLTILGAGVMGLLGSMIIVYMPLVLIGLHAGESDRSISEANLVSYLGALVAPSAVWFAADHLGWKAVGVLGWILTLVIVATLRGAVIPVESRESRLSATPLSRTYWIYWLLLAISVGMEFCFSVWSASFLEKVAGLPRDNAIIGSTAFSIGILSGRVLGILVIRLTGAWRLALVSLVVAAFGFLVFWLSGLAWLSLLGLGLAGLGIANLYATALTLALAAEPRNTARAAARTSIATGLAIILTPLVLGALADSIGLFAGYAIVPLLIAMGLAALWLGAAPRGLKPA